MKFSKFGMVISDTSRSRAYIQLLLDKGSIPSTVFLLIPESSDVKLHGNFIKTSFDESYEKFENFTFNPEVSVSETLDSAKINFKIIRAKSVNENNVIEVLKKSDEKVFVYSGFGGIILRKEVLSIDIIFLHVHGGYLPDYKGSTCNYYSIIEKNYIGAASIIMNEKIDGGPVLLTSNFKAPKNKLLIDHYYDPLIRAIVLVETIDMFLNSDVPLKAIDNKKAGNMYYVIHPVLKHISILK